MESIAAGRPAAVRGTFRAPQFPVTKFGPPALPGTLVARPELRDQLTAGADRRLTVVVGSAGAGKTVLLAEWTAARPPAALQMATLSLRSAADPARTAHALEVRSHEIADYFVNEVLDQQSPEVARFMLDTSVLGELTVDACAAVTARQDAAALLRGIDAAHLFLVALDEHLCTDCQQPVHIPQHGENPPAVDLPEARGDVPLRGGRASRRCAPAVRPRGQAALLGQSPLNG
jgi:hypothetical protein